MHGGQVVIPGVGYRCLPRSTGEIHFRVGSQGPAVPVFVSRGVA